MPYPPQPNSLFVRIPFANSPVNVLEKKKNVTQNYLELYPYLVPTNKTTLHSFETADGLALQIFTRLTNTPRFKCCIQFRFNSINALKSNKLLIRCQAVNRYNRRKLCGFLFVVNIQLINKQYKFPHKKILLLNKGRCSAPQFGWLFTLSLFF